LRVNQPASSKQHRTGGCSHAAFLVVTENRNHFLFPVRSQRHINNTFLPYFAPTDFSSAKHYEQSSYWGRNRGVDAIVLRAVIDRYVRKRSVSGGMHIWTRSTHFEDGETTSALTPTNVTRDGWRGGVATLRGLKFDGGNYYYSFNPIMARECRMT
jgi:hypothetical protein